MKADVLIEKAKYAFECATNKELAALMGIGESAFYDAKSKVKPLRNHLIDIALNKKISIDWLLGHNGDIPANSLSQEPKAQ